jgi:hypothetical protein
MSNHAQNVDYRISQILQELLDGPQGHYIRGLLAFFPLIPTGLLGLAAAVAAILYIPQSWRFSSFLVGVLVTASIGQIFVGLLAVGSVARSIRAEALSQAFGRKSHQASPDQSS